MRSRKKKFSRLVRCSGPRIRSVELIVARRKAVLKVGHIDVKTGIHSYSFMSLKRGFSRSSVTTAHRAAGKFSLPLSATT